MYPAKWFFRKHEDEPTTEVAIRRSVAEDLYVVHAGVRPGRPVGERCRSSSIRWSTGSGSGSACWRSAPASRCCRSARSRSRWRSCRPRRRDHDGAAPADRCCCRRAARAQHVETAQNVPVIAALTTLERELQQNIDLHVRHLRPQALSASATCGHGRSSMRGETRGARRRRARRARRSSSTTSPSTAARSRWRSRSTRGSTGWRGCALPARRQRGLLVTGFVAVRWTRRGAAARAPMRRPPIGTRRGSRLESRLTMSSATLTEPARARSAPPVARPRSRRPPRRHSQAGGGLRPWHFFFVASALLALVTVVVMQGQPLERLLLAIADRCGAGYAGHSLFRMLSPLVSDDIGEDATMVGRADARRARARQDADAARDQGARIRSRDGEDRRRRL